MSLSLQKSQLKKRMLAQPVIIKKKIKIEEESSQQQPQPSTSTQSQAIQPQAPFLYTNTTTPISRQLFEIIQVLKAQNKPLSNQECIKRAAIDIMATPELFEAIKKNERLTFNPSDQTFQFKPRYNIRTPSGLLSLLEKNRGICGMDVKELKESYSEVTSLIDDLEKKGSILVLRNPKDNSARTVYYNDTTYNLQISHVGLKPMTVLVPQVKAVAGGRMKKKRGGRGFKITNTHLVGIDFTKDYDPSATA